ncbi:MAG: hypothetical protein ACE5G8_07215 [Anaerolineae bacterium]
MEFKALRVPTLTQEVADSLDRSLRTLPGVQKFAIILETQELYIMFDENQVGFQTLVQEMAKVGCSLRNIDAALLL